MDTVTQSAYIGVLRPNRSPLVQSGDISHPAKSIAGDTTTVTTQSNIFRVSIAVLYIFAASLGVIGQAFPAASFQSVQGSAAYVALVS